MTAYKRKGKAYKRKDKVYRFRLCSYMHAIIIIIQFMLRGKSNKKNRIHSYLLAIILSRSVTAIAVPAVPVAMALVHNV